MRSSLVVTIVFKGGYSTPASFPDQTEAAVGDQISNGLNPWLAKVSRGRFLGYTRGTTHQYVVVQPKAQLCSDAWVNEVTDQAKAAERQIGTNPDNYDAVVYYFKDEPCGWAGKGDFPEDGNRVILNGDAGLSTLAHEFGHHLGLVVPEVTSGTIPVDDRDPHGRPGRWRRQLDDRLRGHQRRRRAVARCRRFTSLSVAPSNLTKGIPRPGGCRTPQ